MAALTITIARPLYSGSGYRLFNGAGVGLTIPQTVDSFEQAIYDLLTEVRAVIGGPGSTITQMLGQATSSSDNASQYARAALVITIASAVGMASGGFPGALAAAVDTALTLAAVDTNASDLAEPVAYQVAQIGSGATPVTPITPAPSGYGGAAASDLLNASLGYLYSWGANYTPLTVYQALRETAALALLMAGQQGFAWAGSPDWIVFATAPYVLQDNMAPYGNFPANLPGPVNWSAWDGEDTLLAFLTAQFPAETFTTTGPEGVVNPQYVWIHREDAGVEWIRCAYAQWELPYVSGLAYSSAPAGTPTAPVWPGLAGVTLGTPVNITSDTRIEETCDGVIVEVTSVDPGSGRISLAGQSFWYREGFVCFEDDEGHVEPLQWLNGSLSVYCPKTMVQASAVVVHLDRANAATVTPWTRSA